MANEEAKPGRELILFFDKRNLAEIIDPFTLLQNELFD
jgi:hypothetical protein